MFKKRKKKTVKLTEETLKASVITSMYLLSDGMEWHIAGEDGPGNPVVMASPEEIAETIAKYIFWEPSSGSENSSSSSTTS